MQPLTDKEKFVLDRRYGLTDGSPLKLSDIARLLGVSRQNVWEAQRKAVWKITTNSGLPQPASNQKKPWSSTLQRLRATLTYEERQLLKQAWAISDDQANWESTEAVREIQLKAISMV